MRSGGRGTWHEAPRVLNPAAAGCEAEPCGPGTVSASGCGSHRWRDARGRRARVPAARSAISPSVARGPNAATRIELLPSLPGRRKRTLAMPCAMTKSRCAGSPSSMPKFAPAQLIGVLVHFWAGAREPRTAQERARGSAAAGEVFERVNADGWVWLPGKLKVPVRKS